MIINTEVLSYFFSIVSVINGEISKMRLVALDAKDNVDISSFGCIENCPLINKFIGKINGRYRTKLMFTLNGSIVNGNYYYDKIKILIPIKGTLNNKKMVLEVEGEDGEIKEVFNGVLEGNMIQGIWSNKVDGARHPFVFYREVIN